VLTHVLVQVLVETFEEGDNISRYIQAGSGPINHRLSVIGSGTMLQVRAGVAITTRHASQAKIDDVHSMDAGPCSKCALGTRI